MYKSFFGLRERPFSRTPDPRFLYMSRGHEEALARLEFVIEERETAVLTGEIGCGKTTLSRALMDRFGTACRFCYIVNPRLTSEELLRTTARLLGVDTPSDCKDSLLDQMYTSLYSLNCRGVRPVLVIDESQMISDPVLFDEIRLLTNFQLDDCNLLSVLLLGQPELRTTLSAARFEPLRQRIALHYHLMPLTLDETLEYLDFRMTAAGGMTGVFTPDAVMRIYELSGGVPRKINSLATNSLLVAFGNERVLVDSSIVAEVCDELMV